MSVSKRVGAFLCALALVLHLVFVPLRARAFAGVLPAVAAGTVVTAFLMASGVYPYEEQKAFAEYVSDNLSSLWSQYLDWRTENSMNPPVTGNELSGLTGYLTQGVVAISRNVWNVLSEFTSWIVSHFSVTDNQTGVELGTVSASFVLAPYFSSVPSSSTLVSNGYRAIIYSSTSDVYPRMGYVGSSAHDVYMFTVASHLYPFSFASFSFYETEMRAGKLVVDNYSPVSRTITVDGLLYTYYLPSTVSGIVSGVSVFAQDLPSYDSVEAGISDFIRSGGAGAFFGVTADTTTVSALPALPADTPWGGLAVQGATTSATVSAVEQTIQNGVTERERPEVKVIEVELGAGTEVDTETGEVVENPVVVTPDTVIPAVSELTAPQAFLDTLQSAVQTKFPFCLPFDVMRILSALSRQPQAPLIKLTFHDNFSDADYTIEVDLSPWNGVAAIVREMQSILLLLGFWLNFDKFNVLNIILGQLG